MVIVEEKCILHVAWDNPIARGKWRLKKTAAGSEIAGSKSYNGNQIMSQMFNGWIFYVIQQITLTVQQIGGDKRNYAM